MAILPGLKTVPLGLRFEGVPAEMAEGTCNASGAEVLEWLLWFSAGWQHPGPLGPRLEEPPVRFGDDHVSSGRAMETAGPSVPATGAPGASPTASGEASV